MKRTITLMHVAMFMSLASLSGQDRSAWYVSAGWHFVDYYAPMGGGFLQTENWNSNAIPMQFYLGRNLTNRMEIGTSLSILEIDKYPGLISKNNFLDWDVMLQYKFLGEKVAKQGHWFDPYVWIGAGLNSFNNATTGLMNTGGGVDFWVTKRVALNVHTAIDMGLGGNAKHYTHHGVGLKVLIKYCQQNKAPKEAARAVISVEQKKEIEDQIGFSAKNIQFETGSDVIRQESFKDLDNIVMIMNSYPSTRFDIHGHTDNTGGAALNLDLSKRRAASVKKYFAQKGIDASRLYSEGFGQEKPIATNDTAEGRAQNRRVEIKLRMN